MSQFIAILMALCSLASCGKNCDFDIASDQLKFADSIEANNKTYYLYTLTTGWHDKVVYFQLYDEQPELNGCRKISINAIYESVYDDFPDTKYVEKLILHAEQTEKLEIIYTKDINRGTAKVYDVKFTR